MTGFGEPALFPDALHVVVQVHVGGEEETGAGDLPDDGVRLGWLLLVAYGAFPLLADLLGLAAEADDGEFFGVFALEGFDLASDLGQGHGFTSFS